MPHATPSPILSRKPESRSRTATASSAARTAAARRLAGSRATASACWTAAGRRRRAPDRPCRRSARRAWRTSAARSSLSGTSSSAQDTRCAPVMHPRATRAPQPHQLPPRFGLTPPCGLWSERADESPADRPGPAAAGAVPRPGPAPAASPAPAPASAAPALTPAQARAALDVLNDPKKRAEVTSTLEAIAKAQPTAGGRQQPRPPGGGKPAPGQPPPTACPCRSRPTASGAQVLRRRRDLPQPHLHRGDRRLHAMQSLPLLWGWVVVMATNAWARDILLDVAWRVAVALACGLAIEFLLRRLMRRPIAVLEALAPAAASPATTPGTRARRPGGTRRGPDRRTNSDANRPWRR